MPEITKEQLTTAAEDLNAILTLDPPVLTVFESKARGAAKTNAEKKFVGSLKKELISLVEYKDKESGKYDVQTGDIPNLLPETVALIREISPITAQRFDSMAPTTSQKNTPGKSTSLKTKKDPNKKSKSLARAEFLKELLGEGFSDKKTITERLIKDFGDSGTEARYQTNIALQYLMAFGAVKEKSGKFTIA